MEKEGQRRSAVNWLGRALNPMEYLRYYGSDKYRRVYDAITEVDSEIREVAKASNPGIRESLHQARMSMKNREYPKVIYHAWKLLESVDGIFYPINKLESLREEILSEFYSGNNLGKEELSELEAALGKKPEPAKTPVQMPRVAEIQRLLYTTGAPDSAALISEAGPVEWLQENIPTWRQMEGSLLDRIFRNKMAKQKESARKALRMAELTFSSIKDVFNKLDAARTDFSAYVNTAKAFQDKFRKQKEELSALYREYFADIQNKTPEKTTETPEVSVEQEPRAQDVATPETEPQAPTSTPQQSMVEPVQVPTIPEERPMTSAATEYVYDLIQKAKKEELAGNNKIAGLLLVKASEVCDRNGDEYASIQLLKVADDLLDQGVIHEKIDYIKWDINTKKESLERILNELKALKSAGELEDLTSRTTYNKEVNGLNDQIKLFVEHLKEAESQLKLYEDLAQRS